MGSRDCDSSDGEGDAGELDAAAVAEAKLRLVSVDGGASRSAPKRPAPESDAEGEGDAKRPAPSAESVSLRLLVPAKRTPALLGRGGMGVKAVRDATGARVRVLEPVAGCEERVVELLSAGGEGDAPPAAQEALLLVAHRVLAAKAEGAPALDAPAATEPPELPSGPHTVRLLVPGAQTGCIIGRGGEFIRSIRDDSGAAVRLLGEDDVPACALQSERVLQLIGDWEPCCAALRIVCKRLRENPPRGASASGQGATAPSKRATAAAVAAAAAAAASGAQMLAGGGFMAAGGLYMPPAWQGGGVQAMPGSPLPVGFLPGSASPLPGGGNGPPMGAPPGSPSPSSMASITAHMGVPTSAVGCIIGKGGCNVAQIRALSGARVKVHDPAPGGMERLIELVGTPEQVAQAQVLIQGFMMTSGASGGPGIPPAGPGSRKPKQQAQAATAQMGGLMLAPVMMAPHPGAAAMYGWSGQPVMYMAPGGAGGGAMYPMQPPAMGMAGGMMQMHPMPSGMVLVPAQPQLWHGAPAEGMPYLGSLQ